MNDLAPDLARQQRALEWAIALATAPVQRATEQLTAYVQQLPEQPVPCQEPGVYHLLYCSQAVRAFGEEQLADLLEHSLAWNARYSITGLLCYGNGHFVQVLEGEATAVESLFARIARDRRHHQVHVLSRGVGPARRFADWRMAFTKQHTHEFYWLITFLEAHHHRLLLRQIPVAEPQLATTLQGFSDTCPSAAGK
ncbi:BLUF domain-containing protein [Hymenobacter cheonanensis]|uniref:BLUF domain-containing protein n=1 Tax=Hymenobacter sp. CA2-7 TaxID=3063993 RepID=UPI002712F894|nr:BLUF domain-containing protein [Hymenobacter sp. CA2-7]MDO7887940.1 BLUF domain-containing protein [Hymenobacter sp. CA2-7]